jgi:hypothetical protein
MNKGRESCHVFSCELEFFGIINEAFIDSRNSRN